MSKGERLCSIHYNTHTLSMRDVMLSHYKMCQIIRGIVLSTSLISVIAHSDVAPKYHKLVLICTDDVRCFDNNACMCMCTYI
jgi:hypothetical protein